MLKDVLEHCMFCNMVFFFKTVHALCSLCHCSESSGIQVACRLHQMKVNHFHWRNTHIQGCTFDGTCQNTIPEVLGMTQAGMAFLDFFPGIDIANTSTSPAKFWVTMHSGICEISSSHGGEYDVQSCLLGYTAV
jgi:hypothetical protein